MKIKIDQDKCIGCGLCATVAPETFEMDYVERKAKVIKQPKKINENIRTAVDNCPVSAISLEEND